MWQCMRVWQIGKGKHGLIKDDISRYINSIGWNMKTFVSLMKRTIAQKHTLLRPKLKLMVVVWSKVRRAGTPKNLKKGVIRRFKKKSL